MTDSTYSQRNTVRDDNSIVVVSVFLLTFNQKSYIAQTLDSILEQKTQFSYEIVIGDDASTDGTSEICLQYKERYTDQIDYVRHGTNMGLIANFVDTAKRLKGKYVAICDGDDYWTDPLKLQKQVDFLDNNTEFAIVGTHCAYEDGDNIFTAKQDNTIASYTVEQMALKNRISAPTSLFKNFDRLQDLPSYFLNFPYGDWPVYLMVLHSTGSKAAKIPDISAVYRRQIGVSASMRLNAVEVSSKNVLILEELINDKQLSSVKTQLIKGLIKNKRELITALNRKGAYMKAIGKFIGLMQYQARWAHVKWYFYSIKTSMNK
ncbi:Glycosyl transferase family 2 [Nonlabens sp. Hel1_33_55]|uniref:glycosyltransferase family 2 protein n=1 Tax=Nonlabens sp. Hel1_33_55 TaxID=1336802 RepID=UPI000875D0A4|nr:glycosyltransferase [Nonlabens sp. Hel1_33_55]SCX92435.1 Glycosyl transferase family 2 [Nonlabens sp. Hel1_33_55]